MFVHVRFKDTTEEMDETRKLNIDKLRFFGPLRIYIMEQKKRPEKSNKQRLNLKKKKPNSFSSFERNAPLKRNGLNVFINICILSQTVVSQILVTSSVFDWIQQNLNAAGLRRQGRSKTSARETSTAPNRHSRPGSVYYLEHPCFTSGIESIHTDWIS